MKLSFAPYSFSLPRGSNASISKNLQRQGLLLRMEAKNHIGYSDLCPFPDWGDGETNEILRALRELSASPLLTELFNSCPEPVSAGSPWSKLNLPEIAKKSLLNVMIPLEEHFGEFFNNRSSGAALQAEVSSPTNIQILWNPNFSQPVESQLKNVFAAQELVKSSIVVKVKMGTDLDAETPLLLEFINSTPLNLRLRLDFNLSLTKGDFLNWWRGVSPWLSSRLDFIEDPFEFDFDSWQEVQSQFGLALAYDLGSQFKKLNVMTDWIQGFSDIASEHQSEIRNAISVLVLKPARQRIFSALQSEPLKRMKFILTHYMDHPVGQLMGFAESLKFSNQAPARCLGLGFWPYVPTRMGESPKQEEISNQILELSQKLILSSMSAQNEQPSRVLLKELSCAMERIEWQTL